MWGGAGSSPLADGLRSQGAADPFTTAGRVRALREDVRWWRGTLTPEGRFTDPVPPDRADRLLYRLWEQERRCPFLTFFESHGRCKPGRARESSEFPICAPSCIPEFGSGKSLVTLLVHSRERRPGKWFSGVFRSGWGWLMVPSSTQVLMMMHAEREGVSRNSRPYTGRHVMHGPRASSSVGSSGTVGGARGAGCAGWRRERSG